MAASHLLPPTVAACLMVALVPGPLGRLARRGAALYALALTGSAVTAARKRDAAPADAASVPLVLAVMHTSWGLGFLRGAARFGPPIEAVRRLARRAG
jgi:hypothetical protein